MTFIRVNGDDGIIILERDDLQFYVDWMSKLWNLSETKTYVSDEFFSFNSELWSVKSLKKVPIIRWNLIYGLDKFGGHTSDPRVFNTIIEDSPPSFHNKIWNYFVGCRHWQNILNNSQGANWFLPTAIGGLGLKYRDPNANLSQKYGLTRFLNGDERVSTLIVSDKGSKVDNRAVHHIKNFTKVNFGGNPIGNRNPWKSFNSSDSKLVARRPKKCPSELFGETIWLWGLVGDFADIFYRGQDLSYNL
jgi:hypothetical protein